MKRLSFEGVMGDGAAEIGRAVDAARRFLDSTPQRDLLAQVGRTVESVPAAPHPDKRWFQKSFGRGSAASGYGEDLLVGRGLFYVAESRRLLLDCTAGHYQMTWGYAHPELQALAVEAMSRGIAWDNHSNIPSGPVKRLAARLVEIAECGLRNADCRAGALALPNPQPEIPNPQLDTVLLGVCTGTAACAAALKIALLHYAKAKGGKGTPVFVVLEGNYHGTDFLAQRLRGMWPELFTNVEVVAVEPNEPEGMERAFARCGERVAAFWAEPIMMNREAILIEAAFLRVARRLCDQAGALMAIDEIQTGFWSPELMMFRRSGIVPDFVVLGKGMTAGFHPLSALLYRGKLDCLAQYDAISTNGNAALAAVVGLGCIALIEREAERIGATGRRYHERMAGLCAEFPDLLAEARGDGLLTGLKFRRREDALGFHRSAVERGLWVRAHAYHEGHSTVLTKFALPLDDEVAGFAADSFRRLLQDAPWRR